MRSRSNGLDLARGSHIRMHAQLQDKGATGSPRVKWVCLRRLRCLPDKIGFPGAGLVSNPIALSNIKWEAFTKYPPTGIFYTPPRPARVRAAG